VSPRSSSDQRRAIRSRLDIATLRVARIALVTR
jgi:hypothetical protein